MIYVHVPFCRSFCTYCDFYSELACRGRDEDAFERYADGVCSEAGARRAEIADTLGTNTLYIGGGTPSVLPLSCLARMVDSVKSAVAGPFTEFTVEVNPDDIVEKGPAYLAGLRGLGVNRISMGVQSLNDRMLRWMNRRHDADGARKAFSLLREAGFDNLSVDIIFGIDPSVVGGESFDDSLRNTLEEIIGWDPEHISAYQLSVEEGSALGKMAADGRYTEASDLQCASQYEFICGQLREAGYNHYEISNWARPGKEAVHNSAYWSRAPYVGLGPGAHSLSADGMDRSWNSESLDGWTSEGEELDPGEVKEERIMLGLRTSRGIPASLVVGQAADSMLSLGLLELADGFIRIPESKFFVSDNIITQLI